jgi:hypothetical protein
MGCSPTTDALWRGVASEIGDDGLILNLQNDFESIRELPLALIEDAMSRPKVVCVKLWDRTLGPRMAGPRTRILRRAKWLVDDTYSEPVTQANTGWGYGPHVGRAVVMVKLVQRARRELGMMKQAKRLGGLVVRPDELSFKHIGKIKTPRGVYKSRTRYDPCG